MFKSQIYEVLKYMFKSQIYKAMPNGCILKECFKSYVWIDWTNLSTFYVVIILGKTYSTLTHLWILHVPIYPKAIAIKIQFPKHLFLTNNFMVIYIPPFLLLCMGMHNMRV